MRGRQTERGSMLNRWRWSAIGGALLVATLMWEFVEFPPPGGIRPRPLWHHVECQLEKWGLIEVDPFRHVEG